VAALKAFVGAAALLQAAVASADPVDRWAEEIAEASSRFALPQEWIRQVMRAESGGRLHRDGRPLVSSAGAMGLMQLMPGTWRDMRALLSLGPDPWNAHDNIAAGAAYLRLMYDRFGYPGLFAAYDAGPARYAAFLAGRRTLPFETRLYVTSVGRSRPEKLGSAGARRPTIFAVAADLMPTRRARPAPKRPSGLFVSLEDDRR